MANPSADSVTIPQPTAPAQTGNGNLVDPKTLQAIPQPAQSTAPAAPEAHQDSSLSVPAGTQATPLPSAGQSGQPGIGTAYDNVDRRTLTEKAAGVQPPAAPSGSPQASTGQPVQDNNGNPQTKSEWFHHIMKTLTPTQRLITTNPDGTQSVSNNPASGSSIGKLLLGGALAGMMAPPTFRQGAYGPVYAGRQGAGAGEAVGKEWAQGPQKQYDELQQRTDDRKAQMLKNTESNTKNLAMYAAYEHNEKMYAAEEAEPYSGMVQSAVDQDSKLPSTAPQEQRAIVRLDAPFTDLIKDPNFQQKVLQHIFVPHGSQSVYDQTTGQMKTVRTFTVMNPNVKLPLTEDQVKKLKMVNSTVGKAWDSTNGDMKLTIGNMTGDFNTIAQADYADSVFEAAAKSDDKKIQALFTDKDGKRIDPASIEDKILKTAAQGEPGYQDARKALDAIVHAQAGKGNFADVLNRINDPDHRLGGAKILEALGIDPIKAADYVEGQRVEAIKRDALAKSGGNPAKIPAAQAQIQDMTSSFVAASDGLTEEQAVALKNQIPDPDEDGNISMSQAMLTSLSKQKEGMIQKNKDQATRDGDPVAIAQEVNLTLGAGDLTGVKDLFPGNRSVPARTAFNLKAANLATEIGLNPTHFTIETMKEKASKYEEYASTKGNSVGAQLNSFNTFLEHNKEAVDASNEWKRTNSEFWNTPFNQLEKKFGNDPSFQKFKTSLVAPGKEFMNFLNANRAEHEADIKASADILDVNASPSRIYASLQQLAKTADARAASLGDNYVGVVGTTYPRMLNENSLNVMKNLEVDSRAAAFNGQLPRNPQFAANPSKGTLSPQTDKAIQKQFAAAAGYDPVRATEIAREHGWIINYSK
jgi:hypothetical protein